MNGLLVSIAISGVGLGGYLLVLTASALQSGVAPFYVLFALMGVSGLIGIAGAVSIFLNVTLKRASTRREVPGMLAAIVPGLFLIGAAAYPVPRHGDTLEVAAMKSDLRNMVVAQIAHHDAYGEYTRHLERLQPQALDSDPAVYPPWRFDPDVRLKIVGADSFAFFARADMTGEDYACVIAVGHMSRAAGLPDAEPICTRSDSAQP